MSATERPKSVGARPDELRRCPARRKLPPTELGRPQPSLPPRSFAKTMEPEFRNCVGFSADHGVIDVSVKKGSALVRAMVVDEREEQTGVKRPRQWAHHRSQAYVGPSALPASDARLTSAIFLHPGRRRGQ